MLSLSIFTCWIKTMNRIVAHVVFAFLLTLSVQTFAASMTNDIQGVGPKGQIKPYICIQNNAGQVTLKLAPYLVKHIQDAEFQVNVLMET